ncbi:T6SS immunity protein Tdi1 domain-containing protein [Cellulomonas cellasea]|uniref:T6SS immunity protein Tdi1 C-terminal domain-containing protein n=2 Tax=Cellulomonas cellasea TaxID=43670 RepID=A0A0A0B2V1_9CELL|nr:T6SS immunity protein Tdi1 domain-containing protein [Cellulomonas cellasea]KGM01170.1 hypothetical protein Q760_03500 [Cellulomonas cellasea DSM 20118]GEA88031.1 hypothetical protein CCE01nite_19800 [Cellulomonas cellasea]
MPTFTNFTRTAAVAEETVARFEASVPPEIAQVWREDGAGLVGDGFVRVVDPDRATTMLEGVVGMPAGAVPVLTTALADVVLYIRPLFHVLRFRFGIIDVIGFDAAQLLADVQDETFLDEVLARQPYPAGVERLGVPGPDECFGFVPLLALGGVPDPARLDRGGLWEHIAIIMALTGPPQSRASS